MTALHVEMTSVTQKILQEHKLCFMSHIFSCSALWLTKEGHEKHREGRTVLWLIQECCTVSQWHWWAELGADSVTWHAQIAGFWEQSVNFGAYPEVPMGIQPYYLAAGAAACARRHSVRRNGQNVSSNVSFNFRWVMLYNPVFMGYQSCS